jgi:hypothetical protein
MLFEVVLLPFSQLAMEDPGPSSKRGQAKFIKAIVFSLLKKASTSAGLFLLTNTIFTNDPPGFVLAPESL